MTASKNPDHPRVPQQAIWKTVPIPKPDPNDANVARARYSKWVRENPKARGDEFTRSAMNAIRRAWNMEQKRKK